jgi:hypothetical protein
MRTLLTDIDHGYLAQPLIQFLEYERTSSVTEVSAITIFTL